MRVTQRAPAGSFGLLKGRARHKHQLFDVVEKIGRVSHVSRELCRLEPAFEKLPAAAKIVGPWAGEPGVAEQHARQRARVAATLGEFERELSEAVRSSIVAGERSQLHPQHRVTEAGGGTVT